jgi:hypothetical protein
MKTLEISKLALLFICMATLFSCKDDNNELTAPDYSVLGITNVVINNKQFSIDTLVINVDAVKDSIYCRGFQSTQATKHAILWYGVMTKSCANDTVYITSNYSDASIVSASEIIDNNKQITIVVSRHGYHEIVTYKFLFKPIDF